MTDFRALCAELVELSAPVDSIPLLTERLSKLHELACRARAALAQPEPQGPTGRPAIEPVPVAPTNLDAEFRSWYGDRYGRSYFGGIALVECVEWTQFVLARFGRPAIEPVPVSERLPGPEDCDAEGCCWWWEPAYEQPESWCLGLPEYCDSSTHWLPHWALPVPGVEGEP
jgi:hypothetical protein